MPCDPLSLAHYRNFIDIATYLLLSVTIFMHIADILDHSEGLARWTMRVAAIAVILIWVRLLKFARATSLLGDWIAV